jgi:hypothetical protein
VVLNEGRDRSCKTSREKHNPRPCATNWRRLSLELNLDSDLDQENTGGSTDESGTDGPDSVDPARDGSVGRGGRRSGSGPTRGSGPGRRSGSGSHGNRSGLSAGRGDDGARSLSGSAGGGGRGGDDDDGGGVDRGGRLDRDGSGTGSGNDEEVGSTDFTEVFGLEVLPQGVSAERGELGGGGETGILLDHEEDVSVRTGSLERSRSDVVDAARDPTDFRSVLSHRGRSFHK